ncbi:MAG: type II secretion system F family protein [Verrucomicrobiales bacterium]
MPIFAFSALKSDGSMTSGELTASDRAEAMRRLDRSGLQPVSLKTKDAGEGGGTAVATKKARPSEQRPAAGEVKKTPDPKKPEAKGGGSAASAGESKRKEEAEGKSGSGVEVPTGPVKMTRKHVVLFTEELSDLVGAGLQLEPALKIMENRDEQGPIKSVSALLRQKIRDGSSFSSSLRSSSPSFGDLYCSMAAAGEISGALAIILKRQAQYLKSLAELQARVVTALIYPAFLFAAGTAVSVLFVSFLIPQLTGLLKQSGKELPLPAKVMLQVGDFFKGYWWLIMVVLALAVWLFQFLTKHPKYRESWDRIRLKLPLIGRLFSGRFYVQFLETLANLVDNGLPLMRGLELSRDATQNLYLRGLLERVISMVAEGASLSRSLKRVGFFPSLMIDMVTVGEQTGDLPHALRRTAERYDKELEKNIERVQAMIPHVVTVIMAILVGSVAYMMITVIFESFTSMKRA